MTRVQHSGRTIEPLKPNGRTTRNSRASINDNEIEGHIQRVTKQSQRFEATGRGGNVESGKDIDDMELNKVGDEIEQEGRFHGD